MAVLVLPVERVRARHFLGGEQFSKSFKSNSLDQAKLLVNQRSDVPGVFFPTSGTSGKTDQVGLVVQRAQSYRSIVNRQTINPKNVAPSIKAAAMIIAV
jgi:hypothetical protein